MVIINSLIAILSTACFAKLLFIAIQPGQIFEGWQNVLERLDKKGYSIVKPLGYCETCFSFWAGILSWILFFIVSPYHLAWGWVLHYLCYTSLSGIISLYVITKMFR